MNFKDIYGTGADLEALVVELELLSARYQEVLEEESVSGDVDCLLNWIQSYRGGSMDAAEYISEYGEALLASIKDKLTASEKEMHYQGRNTLGAYYMDRQSATKLYNAIALTDDAQDLMETITHQSVENAMNMPTKKPTNLVE